LFALHPIFTESFQERTSLFKIDINIGINMKYQSVPYLMILACLVSQKPSYAFQKTIDTRSITDYCTECPSEIVVTDNTINHSLQHFPERALRSREEMKTFARPDRSTTLINSERSIQDLVNQISEPEFSLQPDKKALNLLAAGSEAIGYTAKDTSSEYILVICVQDFCGDDSYGVIREQVYQRNEVISIYPVCGPEVYLIDRPRQRGDQVQIKVTQKPCKRSERTRELDLLEGTYEIL
jgi:hypothetical protein